MKSGKSKRGIDIKIKCKEASKLEVKKKKKWRHNSMKEKKERWIQIIKKQAVT